MAISLLGGRARGFVLQVPPENITRPTAVLLKRRLFDSRQNLQGKKFIDLCAGSGAMGLEALSRGADMVHLNEMNKVAYRVLEKNVKEWHHKQGLLEGEKLEVSQLHFTSLLKRLRTDAQFENTESILFFDPPWGEKALYQEFWELTRGFPGELWVESDDQKGLKLSEARQHLSSVVKEITQGQHWILVGRAASG
jgi:16S rRNA (guanine966-N2)-methyltransferase